jgi:hypothetical protein
MHARKPASSPPSFAMMPLLELLVLLVVVVELPAAPPLPLTVEPQLVETRTPNRTVARVAS